MFRKKYTKPLTKGELSKLHRQDVRVHFLKDNIRDEIWKVRLDKNAVVILNNRGNYRAFDNYNSQCRLSLKKYNRA